MANALVNAEGLTRHALALLTNNLVFTKSVYRDFSPDHFGNADPKEGDQLKVRLPNRYRVFEEIELQTQDIKQETKIITLTRRGQVPVSFTDTDLTLEVDDFNELFTIPAIKALRNKVDHVGLGEYKNIYQQVGTPGSTPSDAQVILDAGALLDDMGVPRDGMRNAIITPQTQASLLGSMISQYNPQKVISSQFIKAEIIRDLLGFNWEMDQNVNVHTTGNYGDQTIAQPKVEGLDGTPLDLKDIVYVDNFSNQGDSPKANINVGDIFTIDEVFSVNPSNKQTTGRLQQFVIKVKHEWGGQKLKFNFSPTVNHIEGDPEQNVHLGVPIVTDLVGKAVKIEGDSNTSYPINLLFHRDAFSFVSAKLHAAKNADFAATQTHDGFSLRIWRDADIQSSSFPARIDILYEFATIRPPMAVRLIG